MIAFSFANEVKEQARLRQQERCAHCGHSLNDVEEHARHVIPNQSGDPNHPNHAWLATTINCVVLCYACHDRVHENGKYKSGAGAPPDYYEYSHASDRGAHGMWVRRLDMLAGQIWAKP
jgi:5-methylcytosine-specific restriction endonuclease McrA